MRIVATRLHTKNEEKLIDNSTIYSWCQNVLEYCDLLIVVVDSNYLKSIQNAKEDFGEKIEMFHISPWISFTQPLNLLVEKALTMGANQLLFQSIEVSIDSNEIEKLFKHFDEDTLVVGAKLCELHCSGKDKTLLDGWNSPWNTLAMWDIQKLGLTGFLSVSSGNLENIPGGIEEVVTISLLQQLQPKKMKAKIINLPSLSWDTKWDSTERAQYHKKKMKTKNERAQIQLDKLNIKSGKVEIIA
jgi:hypothetical protein